MRKKILQFVLLFAFMPMAFLISACGGPKIEGFKVYIGGVEHSVTNNTITVELDEASSWSNSVVVKLVYDDESTEVITAGEDGYTITGVPASWQVNTTGYIIGISYGEYEAVEIKVIVLDETASEPTLGQALTYTGEEQTGIVTYPNAGYSLVDGQISATNAGEYSATFALDAGRMWADGTTANKTINWSIAKAKLAKPTTNSDLVYTGTNIVGVNGFDATTMEVEGDINATNANSYEATISLKDTTNYEWADETNSEVALTWNIARKALLTSDEPQKIEGLTYNGKNQYGITNHESTYYTASNYEGRNAGGYVSTFVLNSNYKWSDGTTENKTISWNIATAVIERPVAAANLVYNGEEQTGITCELLDLLTVNGDLKATNAGTYAATFVIPNYSNIKWSDDFRGVVQVNWSIARQALIASEEPKYVDNYLELVYNGELQSAVTYDKTTQKYTASGYTSAISAGDYYSVHFILSDNYCWSDGTTANKQFNFSIAKATIQKPTAVSGLVYNGEEQTGVEGINLEVMTITQDKATNAGSYLAVATLKDTANYKWNGADTASVNISWSIARKTITQAPELLFGSVDYNGQEQCAVSGFDATTMEITGSIVGTNAGEYPVTIRPNSNHAWSDGSTDGKDYSWRINRIRFDANLAPSYVEGYQGLTYNGEEQTAVNYQENDYYTILSGQISATNAGTYSVVFRLNNNYCWSDFTEEDKTFNYSIAKLALTIDPDYIEDYDAITYNGTAQCAITYVANAGYTYEGDLTATNAGNYSVTLTPDDNHTWADGSVTPKVFPYEIKAVVVMQPSRVEGLVYNGQEQTGILNVDTSIMEATNYKATNAGNYTATISLIDTNNYVWEGVATNPIQLEWSISPKSVEKPTTAGELVYNGTEQTGVIGFDESAMTGTDHIKTNVGSYTAIINLINTNYTWADDTTTAVQLNWSISVAKVAKPYTKGELLYTGEEQIGAENFQSYFTYAGDLFATLTGTYQATIYATSNYVWDDNTSDPVVINWSIVLAQNEFINVPSYIGSTYGEQIETGVEAKFGDVCYKHRTFNSEPGEYENGLPTNAGEYWVVAYVDATEEYGAIESGEINLFIDQAYVQLSDLIYATKTKFVYTGSEISPLITLPQDINVTLSSTNGDGVPQVEAGNYISYLTYAIADSNYRGDNYELMVEWSIHRDLFESIQLDGQDITFEELLNLSILKHNSVISVEVGEGTQVVFNGQDVLNHTVNLFNRSELIIEIYEAATSYSETIRLKVGVADSVTIGGQTYEIDNSNSINYDLAPNQTKVALTFNNVANTPIYLRTINSEPLIYVAGMELEAGVYSVYIEEYNGSYASMATVAYLNINAYNPIQELQANVAGEYGFYSQYVYKEFDGTKTFYNLLADGFVTEFDVQIDETLQNASWKLLAQDGTTEVELPLANATNGIYYIAVYSNEQLVCKYELNIMYNFASNKVNDYWAFNTTTGEVSATFGENLDYAYSLQFDKGTELISTYSLSTQGIYIVPVVLTTQIEGVTYTYTCNAYVNYSTDLSAVFDSIYYEFENGDIVYAENYDFNSFGSDFDIATILTLKADNVGYTLSETAGEVTPSFEIVTLFENKVVALKVTVGTEVGYIVFNFEGVAEANLQYESVYYYGYISSRDDIDLTNDFNTKTELTLNLTEQSGFHIIAQDDMAEVIVLKNGELEAEGYYRADLTISESATYVITIKGIDGSTRVMTLTVVLEATPIFAINYKDITLEEYVDAVSGGYDGDFVVSGQMMPEFKGYFGVDEEITELTETITVSAETQFADFLYYEDKETRILDITSITLNLHTDTDGSVTGVLNARYALVYVLYPAGSTPEDIMEIPIYMIFAEKPQNGEPVISNEIIQLTYNGETYVATLDQETGTPTGDFIVNMQQQEDENGAPLYVIYFKLFVGSVAEGTTTLNNISVVSPYDFFDMSNQTVNKSNFALILTEDTGYHSGVEGTPFGAFATMLSAGGQNMSFVFILVCADAPVATEGFNLVFEDETGNKLYKYVKLDMYSTDLGDVQIDQDTGMLYILVDETYAGTVGVDGTMTINIEYISQSSPTNEYTIYVYNTEGTLTSVGFPPIVTEGEGEFNQSFNVPVEQDGSIILYVIPKGMEEAPTIEEMLEPIVIVFVSMGE